MKPRDITLRLFQQLHQNDNEYNFRRSSGGCICFVCGLKYRDHYMDIEHPGYNDDAVDHRLCNGDVVHL